MSKGTPPQDALDLVKKTMKAQSAGEEQQLSPAQTPRNQPKSSKENEPGAKLFLCF